MANAVLYEARLSVTVIGRYKTYAEAEEAVARRVASWNVPCLVGMSGVVRRVDGPLTGED